MIDSRFLGARQTRYENPGLQAVGVLLGIVGLGSIVYYAYVIAEINSLCSDESLFSLLFCAAAIARYGDPTRYLMLGIVLLAGGAFAFFYAKGSSQLGIIDLLLKRLESVQKMIPSSATVVLCPKCGARNSQNVSYCGSCGTRLDAFESSRHIAEEKIHSNETGRKWYESRK